MSRENNSLARVHQNERLGPRGASRLSPHAAHQRALP